MISNGLKIIILFCFLLLSGCWDSSEIEETYYVNALGIDYQEGQIEIYVQIVNFQAMAGGGEAKGPSEASLSYTALTRGESFIEAVHHLYHNSERKISWGHLSAVIFTKEALEQGETMLKVFDTLGRFYESRDTVWIFASSSPLDTLLTTFPKANLSMLVSTFGEPIESYEQSSLISPIRLHRFLATMTEPGKTNLLPVYHVHEEVWFEENKKPLSNLELIGTAIIKSTNEFKGFLFKEDILGIRWSQKNTRRTPLVLKNNNKTVGSVTLINPKMKIKPHLKDQQLSFTIDLRVQAMLSELSENVTIKEIEKDIIDNIKKELRHTYEKGLELNADVLQLSHSLYKKSPHLWHKKAPEGELPLTSDSLADIKVRVKIVQTGRDKIKAIGQQRRPINYWNRN